MNRNQKNFSQRFSILGNEIGMDLNLGKGTKAIVKKGYYGSVRLVLKIEWHRLELDCVSKKWNLKARKLPIANKMHHPKVDTDCQGKKEEGD